MPEKMSKRLRERLEFIEFRLYWEGHVNRSDLTDRFNISKPQATIDLKRYQELAPNHLQYDVSRQYYIPSPAFNPLLMTPYSDAYFSALLDTHAHADLKYLGVPPDVDAPPCIHRAVKPEVLREIVLAMQHNQRVKVDYHSLWGEGPAERWIHPLRLIHLKRAWELRVYCHLRGEFRMFLLGRITKVHAREADSVAIPRDEAWGKRVEVVLVPSPKLKPAAKDVVEYDYGMTNGRVTISVRLELLKDFLGEHSLLHIPSKPLKLRKDNGQIAIENAAEIERLLK